MDAMQLLGGMLGSGFGRGRGPGLGTVLAAGAGAAAVGGIGYLAYQQFKGGPPGQPGMMGGQPGMMGGQPGMMGGQPGMMGGQPGMMGGQPGMMGGQPQGGAGGFLQGVVGQSGGMRTDGFSAPGYEYQQKGPSPAPAPQAWGAPQGQPTAQPPAPAWGTPVAQPGAQPAAPPPGAWGTAQPAAWGAAPPQSAAPSQTAAPAVGASHEAPAMASIDYANLPAMPTSPYAESAPPTPPALVQAAPPDPAQPAAALTTPSSSSSAAASPPPNAAPPGFEPDHALAMLLVRAMVSAANADGTIDAKERADILARLDAAGVGADERVALEKELDAPKPVTVLTAEVRSKEVAEQFYVVSCLAIEADTDAERGYLQMLPILLKLDDATVRGLNEKMGRPLPA